MRYRHLLPTLLLLTAACLYARAQALTEVYTPERPVVVVCDWDKPPYEFLNNEGKPTGSNIDVMRAVMGELGLPVRFVMKEWSIALKTFERGDADIILANTRRYNRPPYHKTENIINYNRVRVATRNDSSTIITLEQLEQEGAVFKPGDYSAYYFMNGDTVNTRFMEFQTPKVALMGVLNGDYKYYVWGEEPLKWKLRELNLENIQLKDVGIPISEIHVIGRDKQLIEQFDDQFSRLKQRGDIAIIQDHWLHPERIDDQTVPFSVLLATGITTLIVLLYLFYRLAKRHVATATRAASDLNEMMLQALRMGNFIVMQYDIARNRFTNHYGNILPAKGLTLEEYTSRIHPEQQEEFRTKMTRLIEGRERHFVLDKRWNQGTSEQPDWLNFQGHAISELDEDGRPAYIINAIHDVTTEVEEDKAARDLVQKYNKLVNLPFIPMSFYNRDGWLVSANDSMKELCSMNRDHNAQRFWETVCMFDIPLFHGVYQQECRDDAFFCQHMEYPEFGINNYVECNVQPLFNAEGDVANYFVTTFDITDDRQRDHVKHQQAHEIESMREQSQRWQHLLDFLMTNSDRCLMHTKDGGIKVMIDDSQLREARQRLVEETQRANDSVRKKSAFMASMTHELRTPLNAIVGFTSVIEALGDTPERGEYVRIVRNSSDMLQRLINDIIEASSITDGEVAIEPKDVDFATAFEDICLTLSQRVQTPGVEFQKENPYAHFLTTLDIGRVQQILTNFVTNAVKFTKQGHIRVGYRYEQQRLFLYCEDTGIGIAKDKQKQVFDRFVKLDEFVQGTGMGLAISKSIAERCGGAIGVNSEGPGKGSTFWAWIPCERRDPEHAI